jgi:peroxiredoxin Q/BCP
MEQFAQLDTVVIGISTDNLADQEKFAEKERLNFPLLADNEQKVTKAFGVLMPGRPFAQRATFVLDKKGVIRKIYPKADATKHPDEVLDFLKQKQADKK